MFENFMINFQRCQDISRPGRHYFGTIVLSREQTEQNKRNGTNGTECT